MAVSLLDVCNVSIIFVLIFIYLPFCHWELQSATCFIQRDGSKGWIMIWYLFFVSTFKDNQEVQQNMELMDIFAVLTYAYRKCQL